MSTQMTAPTPTTTKPADESIGIDRAFAVQMARMPLLAVLWVAASFLSYQVWAVVAPEGTNYGPLVVICAFASSTAFAWRSSPSVHGRSRSSIRARSSLAICS